MLSFFVALQQQIQLFRWICLGSHDLAIPALPQSSDDLATEPSCARTPRYPSHVGIAGFATTLLSVIGICLAEALAGIAQ